MIQLIHLIIGIFSISVGSILGYFARQSIAKKQDGTLEARIQERISKAKQRSKKIVGKAQDQASDILKEAREQSKKERQQMGEMKEMLLKKERDLEQKKQDLKQKKKQFNRKVKSLKQTKSKLQDRGQKIKQQLERVAQMSEEEAQNRLLSEVERKSRKEILERMRKLEREGEERYQRRAKEILTQAIQSFAPSQAQDITSTTLDLPSDDIKGRIIGRDGRNIKTLEKLTGVEVTVGDTPQMLTISGFNPVRRQVAKTALQGLIKDGRIQPARIEKFVEKAEQQVGQEMKKAGQTAVRKTGVLGLDPKLVKLLGRLYYRTSFGQNVLLHSIEVSHLAAALAEEIGAEVKVCRKAGLLHDIGKSIDRELEGSHVDIGIKILNKFGVEPKVIQAMKSHHEDYSFETLESRLVQAADAISGARPGARKDTLDQYLQRLEDLEEVALAFSGVEKAWALQAGRELRVFVRPDQIDDLKAERLARDIASQVEQELNYPGEIKVTLIRERRIVEHAR